MSAEGWWIVVSTVRPAAARRLSSLTVDSAPSESRPVVGSSRKTARGSVTSAMPIDTRRRSPPETEATVPSRSSPIIMSARWDRPCIVFFLCVSVKKRKRKK